MSRPIYEIAREVTADIHVGNWSLNAANYALPYLAAMKDLDKVTDDYMQDSGKSVVLYFLSNASTWRGETARRIKAELKDLAK